MTPTIQYNTRRARHFGAIGGYLGRLAEMILVKSGEYRDEGVGNSVASVVTNYTAVSHTSS